MVGDPADETTEVGPMVHPRQRERVLDYIGIGQAEGASCSPAARPRRSGAGRRQPTSCRPSSTAPNDMRIVREEIFGPVVSIIPFDTEEEAIRLANATPYGLSGSIWTRDIGRALRAAKGVQAGVLSDQLEQLGPHRGAVRRLQDVGHRPRAGDARASSCTPRRRTCSSTWADQRAVRDRTGVGSTGPPGQPQTVVP